MSKRSRIPFKHGRKVCIFCGETPTSKEHIWPQWSHPILPPGSRHGSSLLRGDRRTKLATFQSHSIRDGAYFTLKVERACGPCNSTWMSQAETRVRPFVERMIVGDPVVLGARQGAHLAEYLTYKLMLMDWIHRRPILTPEHGRAFHEQRDMPPNFQLFIANCYEGRWRQSFRAVELPLYHEEDFTPELPPNTKSFAIGIGNLFVFAVTSGIELDINVDPASGARLWPMNGEPLQWPPRFPIASDDAEFIANTLTRIGEDAG